MMQQQNAFPNLGAQTVAEWEQASLTAKGYPFDAGLAGSVYPFSILLCYSVGIRKPSRLYKKREVSQ